MWSSVVDDVHGLLCQARELVDVNSIIFKFNLLGRMVRINIHTLIKNDSSLHSLKLGARKSVIFVKRNVNRNN